MLLLLLLLAVEEVVEVELFHDVGREIMGCPDDDSGDALCATPECWPPWL